MAFFFTWVGHGKRPAPFRLQSITMANPGVKKTILVSLLSCKKNHFLHSPTIHSLKTVLYLPSFEACNDNMYSTKGLNEYA